MKEKIKEIFKNHNFILGCIYVVLFFLALISNSYIRPPNVISEDNFNKKTHFGEWIVVLILIVLIYVFIFNK